MTSNDSKKPDLKAVQKAYPKVDLSALSETIRTGGTQVIVKIQETNEEIPLQVEIVKNEAGAWIRAHPVKAGLLLASATTYIVPGIVSGPLLSALGFSVKGPVAGGLGALIQSYVGEFTATSILQSAAMHGSGMAVVNTATSIASAGAGVLISVSGQKATGDDGCKKTKSKL